MAKTSKMLGSMIGFLGNATPGEGKIRAAKPKTHKGVQKKDHRVTRGEKSVTNHGQQHGELGSYDKPTQHQLMKENAKHSMRHATESWVRGDMSTREHEQVHARAAHVLRGRKPRDF